MPNPFTGIITSAMKTLFTNAIDAMLEDDALTIPCRLVHEGSTWVDIPGANTPDPIGNKPPGTFLHGNPRFGPPRTDVIAVSNEGDDDTLYLCVIWDSKSWIETPSSKVAANSPDMFVQSISKISTLVQLKQADHLVIDTDIEAQVRHNFQRQGEPEPCGFGASSYVTTMWKKIG